MPLQGISIGDKIIYKNEHEGYVVNIQNNLGWNEYTVKLLSGLTRICARFQLEKIDNFFHESGANDTSLTESDLDKVLENSTEAHNHNVESEISGDKNKFPNKSTKSKSKTGNIPPPPASHPVLSKLSAEDWAAMYSILRDETETFFDERPQQVAVTPQSVSDTAKVSKASGEPDSATSSSTTTAAGVPSTSSNRFQHVSNEDVREFIEKADNPETVAKTRGHVKLLK